MFTPRSRPLRVAMVGAAVATLLVACDSLTGPEPPDRSAFRTKTIAGIDITSYPGDMGLVRSTPNLWLAGPGQVCGTLVDFVRSPEVLLRVSGDQYVPISHSDLVVGMAAELWIQPGTLVFDVCPGWIAPTHIVVSAPR